MVLEPVEPEIVTREELELRPNAQLRRPEEDEDEGSEDRDAEDEPDPLVLDHCEAFFLSYALGCLVVSDGGEELDLGCNTSVPLHLNVPNWEMIFIYLFIFRLINFKRALNTEFLRRMRCGRGSERRTRVFPRSTALTTTSAPRVGW